MAKQTVNIGSAANDGTGDPLRQAFTKTNQNFDEIYSSYTMTGRLTVGNSTVNTTVANTTGLRTGNSTWNATVNSTSIRISNFANTAILSGSSLSVGANVVANLSAFFVGNATVNTIVSNAGLQTGVSVINSTSMAVGSEMVINSSAISIGNSSSNLVISQGVLTGNVLINGGLVVNGGVTSVNTTTLDVADLNITIARNAANSAAANGAGITIAGAFVTLNYVAGTNNLISSHNISIGNSTVNSTITTTNYSGTANNANNLGGIAAANFIANTNGALTQNSSGHFIVANTGTVVNASGLFVNAAYIGTLTANNANHLGGNPAANYVQNTDSRTLSGNLVISGTYFNPNSNTVLLGNATQRWVISANTGNFSDNVEALSYTIGQSYTANTTGLYYGTINSSSNGVAVNTTTVVVGNSSVNSTLNSTSFSGTANNSSNLGGNPAANFVQNTDSRTLSGNLTFSGANIVYNNGLSVGSNVTVNTSALFIGNSTVNTTINSSAFSGTANNALYAYGKAESALNVNNATTAYGKTENALNVNNATTAYGKTEVNLNVNSASVSNNSTYAFGKTENALNVNSAATAVNANNANNLGTVAAANYVQNTDSRTLSGNLTFTGANVQISNGMYGSIRPRVSTTTSTGTLNWNSDNFEQFNITALATAMTISADSGSPVNGEKIVFRIKDNGTARALTWTNAVSKGFRAVGTTLPTTTNISKTIYVGAVYNSEDQRWDVIGVAIET